MRIRRFTAALVLALVAGSAAQASTILTVSTSYDGLSSVNTSLAVESTPVLAELNSVPVPATGAFEIYQLNGASGTSISAPIDTGPVDTSVPLPPALLLMVSGLFGIGRVTLRRG
jgi:hypothetical protein